MVFKALGHRARLAVVDRLVLGECCVCVLKKAAGLLDISGATLSQHLLVLKSAGIIADEKRGQRVFYRLLMPGVISLLLDREVIEDKGKS